MQTKSKNVSIKVLLQLSIFVKEKTFEICFIWYHNESGTKGKLNDLTYH